MRSFHHHLSGRRRRGKPEMDGRGIQVIDRNLLHFLQHPDPGLNLAGFRVLITKPFDKPFYLPDLALLVVECRQLPFQPGFTLFYIFRIRCFIIIDFTQFNLNRAMGHIIQESPVVRYQHNGPGIICQKTLKPLNGFDIQMIGRFIQ